MDAMWRLLPVTTLTVRQFSGGRTVRLVFALSCLPVLFAVIYLLRPWTPRPAEYFLDIFRELIVPTLLPVVVLLPATAAFGDELEDETLPYLLMKPVSRLRLVLGKYFAVLLVTIPSLVAGLALTALVLSRGVNGERVWPLLPAMAGSAAMGAILLAAAFLLVSLVIPRALLAGMIYIFAWESLLGRFLPGVKSISSREYMLNVFEALRSNAPSGAGSAALTMAIAAAVALGLAVWRLRTMQVD